MSQDWHELTKLTGNSPMVVERVRLTDKDIRIEGEFELPPLARLSAEDQVFVMAFIRSDGSIKELERVFGISYPTVKSRLARITARFEFAEISTSSPRDEIIEKLERGEITAAEAIERLAQ
ncbi:MAG: DUF2089 domain-containing protein [Dehalococcoidales bacterium]|nr:DUF2089 domain-containing protein [Dehalococcoidales bacterium]